MFLRLVVEKIVEMNKTQRNNRKRARRKRQILSDWNYRCVLCGEKFSHINCITHGVIWHCICNMWHGIMLYEKQYVNEVKKNKLNQVKLCSNLLNLDLLSVKAQHLMFISKDNSCRQLKQKGLL